MADVKAKTQAAVNDLSHTMAASGQAIDEIRALENRFAKHVQEHFDALTFRVVELEGLWQPIAEQIATKLSPEGDLVLSGLLASDRSAVLAAFAVFGLEERGAREVRVVIFELEGACEPGPREPPRFQEPSGPRAWPSPRPSSRLGPRGRPEAPRRRFRGDPAEPFKSHPKKNCSFLVCSQSLRKKTLNFY